MFISQFFDIIDFIIENPFSIRLISKFELNKIIVTLSTILLDKLSFLINISKVKKRKTAF